MMKHPFDGVIVPEANSLATRSGEISAIEGSAGSRRSFLGKSLAALGGLFAFGASREASAQPGIPHHSGGVTTQALGEEGGNRGGEVTTYALGEEGGNWGGNVTTYALGEEGGGWNGRVTTYALGEEGGNWNSGGVTTYALGEEGGWHYGRGHYHGWR